ncbi:MAG TPA: tyrosine-type recombinase/integrase [Bryobacteraceae bacterium]|jgi:integrase
MTKADAEAELTKLVQPVNEARGLVEYSLQGFTRHVVFPWYERKWKPSTAMTTKDRVDHHLLKEQGNRPLSSFNRTILQDFLDRKASAGLSTSTVGHLRWDLRQIFRMAVNDGLLQRNPAELLHAPTRNHQRDKRVLSLDELRTLLAALPLREKLVISLAGISGLRPGEILGLQWHDLQPDGLHITRGIYRGIIQTPKTHHSVRTAAISTSIREDFTAWRETTPDAKEDNWVFPNEPGNKPVSHGNYWRRYLKPTLDKLKLNGVTFQALRRTAVTLLNANGADATIVAAQCGHTVDVSTNVYNKVGIKRQQEAIDHLTTALAKQEPLQ